jgi:hypothetical protein
MPPDVNAFGISITSITLERRWHVDFAGTL